MEWCCACGGGWGGGGGGIWWDYVGSEISCGGGGCGSTGAGVVVVTLVLLRNVLIQTRRFTYPHAFNNPHRTIRLLLLHLQMTPPSSKRCGAPRSNPLQFRLLPRILNHKPSRTRGTIKRILFKVTVFERHRIPAFGTFIPAASSATRSSPPRSGDTPRLIVQFSGRR